MSLLNGEAEITITHLFNKYKDEAEVTLKACEIIAKCKVTGEKSQVQTVLSLRNPIDYKFGYGSRSTLNCKETLDEINAKIAKAVEAEKKANLELIKQSRLGIIV